MDNLAWSTYICSSIAVRFVTPGFVYAGDTAGAGHRTRSSTESAKELSGQQQADEQLLSHSPVAAGSAEGGQLAASADASDSRHPAFVWGPAAQKAPERDGVGRTRARKRRRAASQPQVQMSARDLGPDDTGWV